MNSPMGGRPLRNRVGSVWTWVVPERVDAFCKVMLSFHFSCRARGETRGRLLPGLHHGTEAIGWLPGPTKKTGRRLPSTTAQSYLPHLKAATWKEQPRSIQPDGPDVPAHS